MRGRGALLGRAIGIAAFVSALSPGVASANTLYATPFGGPSPPCSQVAPCSLPAAASNAANGDTISVGSGTYSGLSSLTISSKGVTVQGESPRPVLDFTTGGLSVLANNSDGISNLEINTQSGTAVYLAGVGATVYRVLAHTVSGSACSVEAATLRDSVCRSDSGAGVLLGTGWFAGGAPSVRNVTAIGTTFGIDVVTNPSLGSINATVGNTIARASAGTDIAANGSTGHAAVIHTSYTNYSSATTNVTGQSEVDDDGTKQTLAPVFANAPAGDFHESVGSPTIRAGTTVGVLSGETDVDGNPRLSNAQVDIGAYQFIQPVVTTLPATGVTTSTATLNGSIIPHGTGGTAQFEFGTSTAYGQTVLLGDVNGSASSVPESKALAGLAPDTVYHYRLDFVVGSTTIMGGDQSFKTAKNSPPPKAPVLSAFSLSPSSFIAANTGPTIAAAVGTKVSFRLDQAATVTFTAKQALKGVRKGSSCVAPPGTHRGNKARKCTRYVSVHRGFSFAGKAGANHLRFMGRLAGKALKKGSYVLYAVATNSAHKKSKQASHSFKIVG